MVSQIQLIEEELKPLKNQLATHPLYAALAAIDDIKLFMEQHVFAVWDFMSLLKVLQQKLTCTTIPWKPNKNAKLARFINEIVWAEESDVNEHGAAKSHFEMYLDAMNEVAADQQVILNFLHEVHSLQDIHQVITQQPLPPETKEFLKFTFDVIQSAEIHQIAAAFTFGREELIPDLFFEIINQSQAKSAKRYPKLLYYLNRHIELDGDEHGPLALEMIQELCGDDQQKWDAVRATAKAALKARIQLWDGITRMIQKKKNALVLD